MRVELVPGGWGPPRVLGELCVWNVSDLAEDSEYHYALWVEGDGRFARPRRRVEIADPVIGTIAGREGLGAPWVTGALFHRRSDGWVVLVGKVFGAINESCGCGLVGPAEESPGA